MKSWVLVLAGLLLFSAPAFAFTMPGVGEHVPSTGVHVNPSVPVTSNVPNTSGAVEANESNSVSTSAAAHHHGHGHGGMPVLPRGFVEKLHHQGIDVNAVMHHALEQRANSRMILRSAHEREMAAHQQVLAFHQMANGVRDTALQYRERRMAFLQIREEYLRGEVNTEEYFSAAKQFVLSAVDLALDRLNLARAEAPESLQPQIAQEINTLQQLRARVAEVNDLNSLRQIYPRVRSAVITANNQMFARVYYWGLLNATDAVLARLDVASARLAAAVDMAKARGTYSKEIDANVTAVFAQIDSLRAEVNALRQNILAADFNDLHSVGAQLKQIRVELRDVYHEISALVRETRQAVPSVSRQVRARPELNGAVEVNA